MLPPPTVPIAAPTGFRRKARLGPETSDPRLPALVAEAAAGDPDATRELYVRFKDNVYGYVCSIVRDVHEAEDVTQQVFLKVIAALDRYEPATGSFSAWMLRIARNTALDHVKARRAVPMAEVPAARAGDDAHLGRRLVLRAALARLPHDQRRVVMLRHLVGLSPVEIAESEGRTVASVHGLHHRGRRALKAELEAA